MNDHRPEPWLRGPVAGIPTLLQPVAHAFVMACEQVDEAINGLTHDQLWMTPGGIASLGYHLGHLAGSTDRLMTYARGEQLTNYQLAQLTAERLLCKTCPDQDKLLREWHAMVDQAMNQLADTKESTLTDVREVGRNRLPSTVIGLLYHAGEHASRHRGQVVTTARLVRNLD